MSAEHPPKKVEMGKMEDLDPEDLEGYKLTAELEYASRKGGAEPNLEDDARVKEDIDKIENELEEITDKEKEQRKVEKEEAKQKAMIAEKKKGWADRKGWRGPIGRLWKPFSKMILGLFTAITGSVVLGRFLGIFKKDKEGGGGSKPKKDDHGHH